MTSANNWFLWAVLSAVFAALTAIFAKTGWIGRYLDGWGIQAAFSPLGVVIALTFVGMPFMVRTLQPVRQPGHRRQPLVGQVCRAGQGVGEGLRAVERGAGVHARGV